MTVLDDILESRMHTRNTARSTEIITLKLSRDDYLNLLKTYGPKLAYPSYSDETIVYGIRIVVDDNYPPKGEGY